MIKYNVFLIKLSCSNLGIPVYLEIKFESLLILKKQTKKYLIWLPVIFIIILAFVFPYTIHIQNTLTLQALPDFGIKISVWRIIFEPILGLLLFFNRSLYALEELVILLYWILGIYIANASFKYFFSKHSLNKKKYLIGKIINLPIVIGIWFSFFVLIIFIPLPNNTIINNSPDAVLVTTHAHTEYSHDGLISQKGMWEWHKKNNFDAFFITDHRNHVKTFEFAQEQRKNKFPKYPLIMTGQEFSGSNHMSLLGLKNKFNTKGMSDATVVDTTHYYKGVVLINHWFSKQHNTLDYHKKLNVDGYEIENVGNELYYNRSLYEKVKKFSTVNNLIMVGGLDFHGYGRACSIWNAFEIPNWKNLNSTDQEEAIIKIIRNKEQDKLKVLMYNDRPYYEQDALMFSPFRTLFNYFRTLKIFQVFSWLIWLLMLSFIVKKINGTHDKNIVLVGLAGSLFLILLGVNYYLRIDAVRGYTEMYEEYSSLLFYTGFALALFTSVILYFRFFTHNKKHLDR